MSSVTYKWIEFFIIFIVIPISFAFNYPIGIKIFIGFLGFLYVIYILLKVENAVFKIAENLNWKSFWLQTLIKFLGIIIITTLFVYYTDKPSLFNVMIKKPSLWLFIIFIYTFLSVYPQELIYRTFYFKRYQHLFKNSYLLFFINAIVFSLAHFFLMNGYVFLLTFFGGFLFAETYSKTQSTFLVSIEHTIYGCWLFTVGMGGILGFPA